MPELPEVEVTRRAIAQRLTGARLEQVTLRTAHLRYPVPADLAQRLTGHPLLAVARRGKYLLFDFATGHLLVHLGMSGSFRFVAHGTPAGKHDHADFLFGDCLLRFSDPRRFGALLWLDDDPARHPLLAHLGIEPLSRQFTARWLEQAVRGRAAAIKPTLMDSTLVVGLGNIYAAESLHAAGIDPRRPANKISSERLARLVTAIRQTLRAAIRAGGSSLRDFCGPEGLGDFQVQHRVYGRAGQPCRTCRTPIRQIRQGQRSTFFCPRCQT